MDVRYMPGATADAAPDLDEIVASDAYVHIERMEDGVFSVLIEDEKERACFFLFAGKNGRAALRVQQMWRESKEDGPSGGETPSAQ